MIALAVTALISQAATEPQPCSLTAASTAEGAKRTISRLIAATEAGDDPAFDKIARGMVIMVAPDFGVPAGRGEFAQALKGCTTLRVQSAAPFPKMPQAQAVRVTMRCRGKRHQQSVAAVADFMADDEHAFAMFPGGVARVWPSPKP